MSELEKALIEEVEETESTNSTERSREAESTVFAERPIDDESTLLAEGIHTALLNVQRNAPSIQKDSINPHFKNKYISLDNILEKILPILNENDILLMQFPEFDVVPMLRTELFHVPTNQKIECRTLLSMTADRMTPQDQGSAITYARRYALMAILGLVADVDDDAGYASRPRPVRSAPETPAPKVLPAPDETGDVKAADPNIRADLLATLKGHISRLDGKPEWSEASLVKQANNIWTPTPKYKKLEDMTDRELKAIISAAEELQ